MNHPLSLAMMCTTRSWGGLEMNTFRMATWLKERGNRVLIVASRDSMLAQKAQSAGLETFTLRNPMRYGDLIHALQTARALRFHSIPILMTHTTKDINLAVLTAMVSHNRIRLWHYQHMQLLDRKRDAFHRWQHEKYHGWIVPLPSMAKQFEHLTCIHKNRIHIVPLGIDFTPFERPLPKTEARKLLNLPPDAFIAGVVGRLDPGKGQEFLVQALARIPKEMNVHALIAGDETLHERSSYRAHLQRTVSKLDLEGRVHFLSHREDIVPVYRSMDVFALTSLSESYGMVTIEAMAAGLPIIATDTAGTPEIIDNGRTGILIPSKDPDALASALVELIHDRERVSRYAEAAEKDARHRFSHAAQCESLERLLHSS